MVLVSDKPSNGIGILQTKLSYRKGYEARRGGPEAMPLDQHIEGRHGEREPRLKRGPHTVHDFLDSIGFFIFPVPEVPVTLRMKEASEGCPSTGRCGVDEADEAW